MVEMLETPEGSGEFKQKDKDILPDEVNVVEEPKFLVCDEIDQKLQLASLDFIKKQEFVPRLNLFLCSPGGSPNVAFNTVNILRQKCDKIVAYVLDSAKSAATLMCLGADEIVMDVGSQLGPLDMQIPDPRNSTENISALSGYRALEAVADFLHNEIDVTVKQLCRKARTNISDSLKYAMELADSMARPLFEQVNPLDLGRFTNALMVSEAYASELLSRYGPQKTDHQIKGIVSALVRSYPSHSFVIDLPEAKKIGLNAREPNKNEVHIVDNIWQTLLRNPSLQKHGVFKGN